VLHSFPSSLISSFTHILFHTLGACRGVVLKAAGRHCLPLRISQTPCVAAVAAAAAAVVVAVNLRWWLEKADLKATRLYTINGLLMLLVWGVARVVMFVPFYIHVLANWVSPLAVTTSLSQHSAVQHSTVQ